MMLSTLRTPSRILVTVLSTLYASPATWSQTLEICNLPEPPTVVVSVPGAIITCATKTVPFHIHNTHGTKRIQFTILGKSVYPLSIFDVDPEPGGGYILDSSPVDDSVVYRILPEGAEIGAASLTLSWRWSGCGCSSFPGCPYFPPALIGIANLYAIGPGNSPLPVIGIPGGIVQMSDGGPLLLLGRVLYSNSMTPVIGAEVIVFSVGGVRLDSSDSFGRTIGPEGEYWVGSIGDFPPGVSYVLMAQSWLPGDCSSRTVIEEIPWGGLGTPAHHDFILPVPPPSPDPTPTPTEAPSCVDPGRLILYD